MITVIDTETGSLDGPLLEIAFTCYDYDGHEVDRYQRHIRHMYDYEIHPKAFEVNGLTKEFLEMNGAHAWPVLNSALTAIAQSEYVVGHNLTFDLRMLRAECLKYGVTFDYSANDPKWICTQNTAAVRHFVQAKDRNNKLKAPNLSELHFRLFGEAFSKAHTAMGDVEATARCYFELKKRQIL